MYQPNQFCVVQFNSKETNVFGQPVAGASRRVRCAVVRLIVTSEKSTVRADSSASRGNAMEQNVHSTILFGPAEPLNMDDIVSIANTKLRIVGIEPRYSIVGVLDHQQVTLTAWRNT